MRSRSKKLLEDRRARPFLGTVVEIALPAGAASAEAMEKAFAVIARVQALMSAHDAASDLGRLHAAPPGTAVQLHPWTWRVLAAAERMRSASGGVFDVVAAGRAALERGDLPSCGSRESQRQITSAPPAQLKLDSSQRAYLTAPGRIDLGGIAKGFAVDQAVRLLKRSGVSWGLVNAGGDLRGFGPRTWTVHLRHPGAPGQLLPHSLRDSALATSAPYFSQRIQEGRLTSALLDARSGQFITKPISVSVFAPTCLAADALTKTIAAGGDGRILQTYRARALVLLASEKVPDAA